jgi:transcriptional regulator with XRE-family HTH domain
MVLNERRAEFCRHLKAAREKAGISLEQIAAATKISRSLFSDLECNNLSRWPKGIYRRSYLRDYMAAIKLAPETMMAEFARLFPDDDAAATLTPEIERGSTLTLTLAEDQGWSMRGTRKQLIAAALDLSVIGVVWVVTSLAAQMDIWMSGTIVALAYYCVATAVMGQTPAMRWLERRHWAATTTGERIAAAPSRQFTSRGRKRRAWWKAARASGLLNRHGFIPPTAEPSVQTQLPAAR